MSAQIIFSRIELQGFNLRPEAICIPSLLLQHFPTSLEAEEVHSLFDLVNGQKRCRVLVLPVPAGREVLQEDPSRILQILLDAIDAAKARSLVLSGRNGEHPNEDPTSENIWQRNETSSADHNVIKESRPGSTDSGSERQVCVASDSPSTASDWETDQAGHKTRVVHEDPSVSTTHAARGKSRRAREFDLRKERAAERKRRNERLRRQDEIANLRKAKKQMAERANEQGELAAMEREDNRSRAADDYLR